MTASSAALLQASTAFAPVFAPLPSRLQPAPRLYLHGSPNRRRGSVALTASSAASPEVEKEPSTSPSPQESQSAVADSVKVLKEAAKTRKVPAPEVLSALSKIKKAKLDTSTFFETLCGTESPGSAGERAVFPSDCSPALRCCGETDRKWHIFGPHWVLNL